MTARPLHEPIIRYGTAAAPISLATVNEPQNLQYCTNTYLGQTRLTDVWVVQSLHVELSVGTYLLFISVTCQFLEHSSATTKTGRQIFREGTTTQKGNEQGINKTIKLVRLHTEKPYIG